MDPNTNPTPPVDPATPPAPVTPDPAPPAVTPAPTPAPVPPVVPTAGMPGAAEGAPRGWNWGAFWLTWIWGASHGVWISFLSFVPFVGIVMPFVLGAKGNEWAWEANHGRKTLEQFKATEHTWAKVGLILAIVAVALGLVGALLLVVFAGASDIQARATANEFMVDLQNNDPTDAYKITSNAFQTINSPDDFATTVGEIAPNIKGTVDLKEQSVTVNNGVGAAEFDATVAGHTLDLKLTKASGGSWVIDSVSSAQ